jgi:hypothetical protein
MMTPKDYLRRYTEAFQPPETESSLPPDESDLMLERGYYYPPYLQLETYLDTLSRADLLEIAQQLLATEYPAQRLIRRQVGEYLEAMQRLKDERAWRQAEMERLNAELTWRIDEMANLELERKRLETLVLDSHAELESCRNQISILDNHCATLSETLAVLRGSTSWKVTRPLRWFGRMVKAGRTPDP